VRPATTGSCQPRAPFPSREKALCVSGHQTSDRRFLGKHGHQVSNAQRRGNSHGARNHRAGTQVGGSRPIPGDNSAATETPSTTATPRTARRVQTHGSIRPIGCGWHHRHRVPPVQPPLKISRCAVSSNGRPGSATASERSVDSFVTASDAARTGNVDWLWITPVRWGKTVDNRSTHSLAFRAVRVYLLYPLDIAGPPNCCRPADSSVLVRFRSPLFHLWYLQRQMPGLLRSSTSARRSRAVRWKTGSCPSIPFH